MADLPLKKSPVELEKEKSRHLRGTLAEQLAEGSTHFKDSEHNLLKCHGMYQQDDRDLRQDLLKQKKEKAYSLMVRAKIPGGRLKPAQYLALDELADRYGNGTMRITTRQGIQFHGVLKKNVKAHIKSMNDALLTTFGACGDVVRNVCSCPAPLADRLNMQIHDLAQKISDRYLPQTHAYHEIWMDGEKVSAEQEQETIYGDVYLPRKFKIAIAYPGDNCVDIYTHDIGIIPVLKSEKIQGFNLVAGGGMGKTHNIAETYPLLAKPYGWVAPDRLMDFLDAMIKVQRDFGNRSNRKRARLKYLIEERGMDWFINETAKWMGEKPAAFMDQDWSKTEDHLGWHANGRGSFFFGLFVENGRIKDKRIAKIRSGIRDLVREYKTDVYLTLHQNILFDGIAESQKTEFEAALKGAGLLTEKDITPLLRWSMACPALPTCGLAITESERALPAMIRTLEKIMSELGLAEETISLRMTGCPNGCTRPYTSELGIVGQTVGKYALYAGGDFEGKRLNQVYLNQIKAEDVIAELRKLFMVFKTHRNPFERFGDFCHRIGMEELRKLSQQAV